MVGNSFQTESAEAQRLVRERPSGWEYLLTGELLRNHLVDPQRQWRALQAGIQPTSRLRLNEMDVLPWMQTKMREAQDIAQSLERLYSKEVQKAWGAPGVEGDPDEILFVAKSIGKTAAQAVKWEQDAKYVDAPDLFLGLIEALQGAVGGNIGKLCEANEIMSYGLQNAFENPDQEHVISHTIVLELPPGWNERIEAELSLIGEEYGI